MNVKEEMLKAGVPEHEISSHESDLYVKVSPISQQVLERYEFKLNVTMFRSLGHLWYDIPFANDEFWERKLCQKNLQADTHVSIDPKDFVDDEARKTDPLELQSKGEV